MTQKKIRKRNQNNEDESSKKKVNTGDNGGVGPWSNLNHQLLYLVMLKLGFVDYFSFGGVCKSWRSLAISNRKTFIASKQPMKMHVSWCGSKKLCYLEDKEGRKFKTILPHFAGGACVGLTCGYLIFFKRNTRDFWLVHPITRHQLHFPDFPMNYDPDFATQEVKAILVFSPSMSDWVLVVLRKFSSLIWFSIKDTGEWEDVSCTLHFTDLCFFNGIIYTLNVDTSRNVYLCKLRLNPEPKVTLFKTKNSIRELYNQQLVSSDENIYVMAHTREDQYKYKFQELDYDEREWVLREKEVGESASFLSNFKHGVVDIHYFWGARGHGLLLGHNMGEMLKVMELERANPFTANMWYLPHECLNVDRLDE